MKRRIFVAIDLPAELKQKVAETIKQWHWLPIRWLKPENWHITVIPPVYLDDAGIKVLSDLLRTRRLVKEFRIEFKRAALAPPGVQERMIWLDAETAA